MKRRVVVTGVGLISCLGNDADTVAAALLAGASGIRGIPEWAQYGLESLVGGVVDIDEKRAAVRVPRSLARGMSDGALYALLAAIDAVTDAGLGADHFRSLRTGVSVGSSVSGCEAIFHAGKHVYEGNLRQVDPYTVFRGMSNTASAAIANLFKIAGRSYSIASACATGAHNIGHAFELIQSGRMDRMIAGGTEEFSPMLSGAFQALRLALSTKFNDRPKEACRPYDVRRDGVVLSGGAGIVVLEALECAIEHNASIRAEVLGFGANSEGYDLVMPEPDGNSAALCMKMALDDAGLRPEEIDYINTHGTATIQGDIAEINGIKQAFPAMPPFSSTKSMTGHALGAAGALEAIFCIAMLERGFLAPSINIEQLDPVFEGLPVVRHAMRRRVDIALTTSFGFGGTNATLVLARHDRP